MTSFAARSRFRRATEADLPALLDLNASADGGARWPQDVWQRRLAATETAAEAVLLAVDPSSAMLQGWVTGAVVCEIAELESVLVRADCRCQGLGQALVRRWMEWSARHGASRLHLEVRAGNAAALRLYRRLGFVEQGTRPRYYRNPVEDALLMELRLDQNASAAKARSPR